MTLYQRDEVQGARLDGRRLAYQFDVERDIPWHELSAPGWHLQDGFLRDVGYEVDGLDPEAAALLDWAFGLAVCEAFLGTERGIMDVLAREGSAIPESRSIELLLEEERKHTVMFERYRHWLRSRRPEHCDLFDQAYAPDAAVINSLFDPQPHLSPLAKHYFLWLHTLFFEEYTIYIDERIGANPAGVQPVWRALHTAHRREEQQHVVTDEHYMEALPMDDATRRQLSEMFTLTLLRHFDIEVAVAGPLALLAKLRPDVTARRRGRISETPMFRAFLDHRAFRRSRRFVPYLEELR